MYHPSHTESAASFALLDSWLWMTAAPSGFGPLISGWMRAQARFYPTILLEHDSAPCRDKPSVLQLCCLQFNPCLRISREQLICRMNFVFDSTSLHLYSCALVRRLNRSRALLPLNTCVRAMKGQGVIYSELLY